MLGLAKIPWTKVYQYYISSETVTYDECAKKFHVSIQAVKEHGSAEHWTKKKQEIMQAALVLMDQRTAELIAQRNAKHVGLAQTMLEGVEQQLATKQFLPKSARDVKDWLDIGVKIERQGLGMNTNTGSAVKISNEKGQTLNVTWGDGSSLEDY